MHNVRTEAGRDALCVDIGNQLSTEPKTSKQLAAAVSCTQTQARNALHTLIKRGLAVQLGNRRSAKYARV